MRDLATIARKTRAWACYDCGKCTATCPLTRAGRNYSPRRHVLATVLGQQREILEDGTLYSCLTCSHCDQRCPAQVNYTDLVRELRALAFHEGIEPDCPHGGALQSVMRVMARGQTVQDRLSWLTDDLKVRPKEGKVFYWTGCTMYYDAFFQDLNVATLGGTRAAIRLLNRLGIEPVVSAEERCCGHDLLWSGDEATFESLARHNVGLVAESGAELVITSCAECLRTWVSDYPAFMNGRNPRILHLSEFLAERLPDLTLRAAAERRITFQDPCRLGRHLGIYESPRKLLSSVPGVTLIEMGRSGKNAVCCAGGTWSNCDRFAKQIQVDRLREARATGAELLVTACPKCQIHFKCAMKDPRLGKEIEIEIRDVAELVSEALA